MPLAWQAIDTRSDPDEPEYLGDPADLAEFIDAASFVAAIVHPPEWHSSAACRGRGIAAWFPDRGEDLKPARQVCADCTVKKECLLSALELSANLDSGVWGGTSARERLQLRRTIEHDAA